MFVEQKTKKQFKPTDKVVCRVYLKTQAADQCVCLSKVKNTQSYLAGGLGWDLWGWCILGHIGCKASASQRHAGSDRGALWFCRAPRDPSQRCHSHTKSASSLQYLRNLNRTKTFPFIFHSFSQLSCVTASSVHLWLLKVRFSPSLL